MIQCLNFRQENQAIIPMQDFSLIMVIIVLYIQHQTAVKISHLCLQTTITLKELYE